MAQTAPPKVPAKPSSSRFGKDTKIGHFLKFFKGGTNAKSQKKEGDFGGSKIASAQTALSFNYYALKVQSSENILAQTAPPKVLAVLSFSRFVKDTKIGHFLKFFKGGTKKKLQKKGRIRGSKVASAQTALLSN